MKTTFRPAMDDVRNFFITGLPRSRTAWLANFLTYGPATCLHDGVRFGGSDGIIPAMNRVASEAGAQFVGNSDSALALLFHRLDALAPGSPWVYVNREPEQALRSFLDYFARHRYANLQGPFDPATASDVFGMLRRAGSWLKQNLPDDRLIEVEFDDLDNESCGRAIWEHCVPGVPFNATRWRMLNAFRVTVISEKVEVP